MADLTRTYTGDLPAGRLPLPTRKLSFRRGVPVTVTPAEAEILDCDPAWAPKGGPGAEVLDLELLDKPALLDHAERHGIAVNARLGATNLRKAIAAATTTNTDAGSTPGTKES